MSKTSDDRLDREAYLIGQFELYCQNAPDSMLEGILEKEFEAGRTDDYAIAKREAARRGWAVSGGQRM